MTANQLVTLHMLSVNCHFVVVNFSCKITHGIIALTTQMLRQEPGQFEIYKPRLHTFLYQNRNHAQYDNELSFHEPFYKSLVILGQISRFLRDGIGNTFCDQSWCSRKSISL